MYTSRIIGFWQSLSLVEAHPAFPAAKQARDISSWANAEDSFNLARNWLENCLSTHNTCASTRKPRLPTRVIDVGSSASPTSHLRLYIPGRREEAEYIALSHCWGASPPLQTTRSNIEAMCNGIKFADLPRNFQDAVTVVRAFGVRYLWIDSLCILQDSLDDWALESQQMSRTYYTALFVLAAAAGDNCESGFLAGAKRNESVSIVFSDSETRLSVRRIPQMIDPYGSHFRHRNKRSKLSTRGWAFQEQLLARRILSYSDEEMSWECLEDSLCECQITGSQRPKSITARLLISSLISVMNLDRKTFHSMWTDLVQEYTLRELTFPSDRLTAFSGIASIFCSSPTSGEYLAGVWENYLLSGLAWSVGENSQIYEYGGFDLEFTSKRQEGEHAPSWSWASVTGPITFWSVTVTKEPEWDISVRDIRFKTRGVNVYGSPAEAALDFTGRLLRITIGEPKFGDSMLPRFKVFFPDSQKVRFYANPDIWDEHYYHFGQEDRYYLLSIFHYKDDNRPQNNSVFATSAAALALILKVVTGENDCYERVACVLLTKEEHALYLDTSEETMFTLT